MNEGVLFTIDGDLHFDWRAHHPRSLVTDVTPTGTPAYDGHSNTLLLCHEQGHCLDRTPDCTFWGTGLLLPRWRTGKPARGRYLFYNHFISIIIVIQYQRPDLRTLYAFLQSSLVSLFKKSHRYGYGGIISSAFVYILIF